MAPRATESRSTLPHPHPHTASHRLQSNPSTMAKAAQGKAQEQEQKLQEDRPPAALLSPEEYFRSRSEALSLWVPVSSFTQPPGFPNLLDQLLQQGTMSRSTMPSPSELAAKDHQLAMACLDHYNLNHPENEYVPAPGEVTTYSNAHNGTWWTHGNFVASPKLSDCFSFLLPAPRTLFFFELVTKDGFESVVSCTPLDEPVTEANNLLGLGLGWGTRRDGSLDCRCKTCNQLVRRRLPFVGKSFPCGHYEAKCVCEMCYIHSKVLHPSPQKFAFGHDEDSCAFFQ